ncbi:MAG: HAMP domain-containing histidine kinase [Bacteroidetes bacterium]|nr:HAMP domain-containing histidine kinase [Bacteroidota bacterium]
MKQFLKNFLQRNFYLILAAFLLFAGGYSINFLLGSNYSDSYWKNAVQGFLQEREKDFVKVSKNDELIQKLKNQDYNASQMEALSKKKYSFLLYEKDSTALVVKFWNSQQLLPPDSLLHMKDGNYFFSLENGQYEFVKRTLGGTSEGLVAIGLIPVRLQYYIAISGLKPEFVNYPEAENRFHITSHPAQFSVKSYFGNTAFYLEKKDRSSVTNNNWLSHIFILLAVILLLAVIHNMAHNMSEHFGPLNGIAFLVLVVFLLRLTIYQFPSLFRLRQFELFSPTIYSSSFVLSSLGDLLINSLLLCWIVLFIKQEIGGFRLTSFRNKWKQWSLVLLMLIALLLITYFYTNVILSLVADARISFSVTNFFSLNEYSFIGFLVLATLALSYFFITQVLLHIISQLVDFNDFMVYIIVAFLGLLLLTFIVKSPDLVSLDVIVLIWLLLYIWLLQRKLFSNLNMRLNVSEVLFWLFVFSASISSIIFFANKKIEIAQRIRTADRLAQQADPSSERVFSIALAYIDNDFLSANFHRFQDKAENEALKDSLINSSYSTYRTKYDMKIFTYDSAEKPLFNARGASYDTLNTIYNIQGKPTGLAGLHYYEKSFDKYTYIYKKKITDTASKVLGYMYILSDLKDDKNDELSPELFNQQKREFFPEYSPEYSYAVYDKNELVDYGNNYPFPSFLTTSQFPKLDYERRRNGSYEELWHRVTDDKIVVIAKKDNSLLESVTLFAYLFTSFIILLALVRIVSLLIATRLHLSRIRPYMRLNIRTQIHATIISISLFSFLVIGTATIFFFIDRYERNNQNRLSEAIRIAAKELEEKLPSPIVKDSLLKFGIRPDERFETLLKNFSEIHGVALNLYNLNGNLELSTNPFVYDKGVLSKKMDPVAYYNLHLKNAVEFFNKEQMAKISYLSIYCPLRDLKGNTYAYLNIPSFTTQDELKQEISNFLEAIVILNAFIFLVAGAIALFLTNRITYSFTLISEKMTQVNLGKTNEEVQWDRDDEIGGLVKEYNKMVKKLEASAAALGKSEREGAWREMARQVAHEIKNPLTPMKLSIQYLQKAVDNDSVNIKEMTASVAKTLVEQIDHLAKIAADFSQFANIGNPKLETFDLHDLLYSLSSLYERTENLLFKWVPVSGKIIVHADKTQLNRLFTNLLQNAVEACTNKEKRVISMSEEIVGNDIIIKVSDNGEGIPLQTQSKIFTPNFTTKSSGTGLGLAMSKTIVEQAKGKIWFETKENQGSTFFVELPMGEPHA